MARQWDWIERLEQRYPDYDVEEVPEEARKPWHLNTMLWMAWVAILAPTLVGAALAGNMTIWKALAAILIGNVVISAVAVIMGLIGQRQGLGTGTLARYSFGIKGARIAAFLMGGIMFLWSALDNSMAGFVGADLIGHQAAHFVPVLIIGAIVIYAVIHGIQGPAWVAYATVPVVLILYLVIAISVIKQGGGWSVVANFKPEKPMSMSIAITLVIASWINGSVMAPDLVRVAKDRKGVWFGPPAGLIIMNSCNLFLGVVAFTAIKAFGMAEAALALTGAVGVVAILGFYLMILNTNPTTIYTSALEFASISNSSKIRWLFVICPLVWILSYIINYVSGVQGFVIEYLPWVAATMTAIAGVVIADYWLTHKGRYPGVHALCRNYNWIGILAFVLGTAVNMITYWLTNSGRVTGWGAGVPGINGLVISAVVMYLVSKAAPGYSRSIAAACDAQLETGRATR